MLIRHGICASGQDSYHPTVLPFAMKSAKTRCLLLAIFFAHGVALAEEPATTDEKKPGFFSRVRRGVTGLFDGKNKEPEARPKETPAEKPKPNPEAQKVATPKKKEPEKKPEAKPASTPKATKPRPADTGSPKPKATPAAKSEPKKQETPPAPKAAEKPAAKSSEKPPAPAPAPEKPKAAAQAAPEPPAKPAATTPAKEPAATASATAAPKPETPDTASKKPGEAKGQGGEFDDVSAAFGPKKPEPAPATAATTKDNPPPAENLPPPPPLPAADGSWDVVKLNGRDYITADSIQRFFRFSTLKRDGKRVWLRSPTILMRIEIGSLDLVINNIKFILSVEAAESGGKALISRLDLVKLLDPVLRPSHITTSEWFDTVVVDAGHGGHDSGAKGVYGYEKDFTLQMATTLRDCLQKRGFKVVLTRSTDDFITLGGRVAIANATPRSIFVSLHFNSSSSEAAGIETWSLSPQGASSTFMGSRGWDNNSFDGNRRDSENIALATAVHGTVIHRFNSVDGGIKLIDRGIKRARWTVLTGCTRPGILFEGGFVTNATEGRYIAAANYRQAVCDCLADAVVTYRRALQPRVGQQSTR